MQHLQHCIAVGRHLLLADPLHLKQAGLGSRPATHQLQQRPIVADHIWSQALLVGCLSPPAPQPVISHPLALIKFGQKIAERVLTRLRVRRDRLLRIIVFRLVLTTEPSIRNAQRPVRDAALHEGERVDGEQLSTHQEITQPLVREALEERIER